MAIEEPTTTCLKCRFECIGESLPTCNCGPAKEAANAARIETVCCEVCGSDLTDGAGCAVCDGIGLDPEPFVGPAWPSEGYLFGGLPTRPLPQPVE